MADPKSIERELREYLEKEPNLRRGDRLTYLMGIINKHMGMDKLDHMVTKNDLFHIISDAKQEYTHQRINPEISGRPVDKSELTTVAVIEAFVSYLNRNALLKKLVKMDYTDPSNDFESTED